MPHQGTDPQAALDKPCVGNVFYPRNGPDATHRLSIHVDGQMDADLVLVAGENLSSFPLSRESAARIIQALNTVYPGVSMDHVEVV